MNSFFLNISLFSLATHHYAPSPLFSIYRSRLYFNGVIIDRSFSTFSYNNRFNTIKNSKFLKFINSIINVDNSQYGLQFNGYFQSNLDLDGVSGHIGVINSLFYNINTRNSLITYNCFADAIISIANSHFISISSNKNIIDLKCGASLTVNSSCFYKFPSINSVFENSIFLKNYVQLNGSSFLQLETTNALVDCNNCSFYMNNDNFTSNKQKYSSLMKFQNMNLFIVNYLNLHESITNDGIDFIDFIDQAIFNNINVYNSTGNTKSFVFIVNRGSIYVEQSSFNINFYVIQVNRSTAFFYNCNSTVNYNSVTNSRLLWTINCRESISSDKITSPDPANYPSILYCANGSFPSEEDIQVIFYNGREKAKNEQLKGATEILGILLFVILGIVIIGLSLWLILYFFAFKNPLREFNEHDDQLAKWKNRWDWIQINSNKAVIEHKECSDIELDPIELSEEAIKRRHPEIIDAIQNNLSDSQKSQKDNFEAFLNGQKISDDESQKLLKQDSGQNGEDNKSKSDEKDESLKAELSESVKSKKEGLKTQNLGKTLNPKGSFYRSLISSQSPTSNKKKGKANDDDNVDDLSLLRSTRTKALKIHFSSSDENKTNIDHKEEEDIINPIISDSGDLDDDDEKIRNDLETTLTNWNRFQKTGIDKSLGVVEENSESSFEFNTKKHPAKSKSKGTSASSDSWSDDGDSGDDGDVWSDDDGAEGDDEDDSSF
ncbi:hypothetical protein M9Y10_014205 [Tritrichomonas musculus]|uniref:Right handed beta helix domain-containing protein n=1 Tax=Tritrichomonas musculus TaxID=1915356 RepID=A0ABR2KZH2_9EUKA